MFLFCIDCYLFQIFNVFIGSLFRNLCIPLNVCSKKMLLFQIYWLFSILFIELTSECFEFETCWQNLLVKIYTYIIIIYVYIYRLKCRRNFISCLGKNYLSEIWESKAKNYVITCIFLTNNINKSFIFK